MGGITVTRRGDRLLATKTADDADRARRLRDEAAVLQRLRHPGVVEVVALDEGPPLALHTGFVGTDTWATRPPATGMAIVEGLSAVASTVADLHALGIAHGALTPDHVLVAADGRPVLCGLADGTDADDPAVFADVRALAELIERVGADAPTVGPGLAELAQRAAGGGLTAQDLATTLAGLRAEPGAPHRRARARGLPVALAAATAAAAIVMSLAGWLSLLPDGAAPERVMAGADQREAARRSAAAPATPPTTTAPPPPINADGSAAPVPDGPVLEHAGRRYAVGGPDDVAAVGDWNCDGTATPAVLDPAHGTVSFFLAWPEPGGAVEAQLTLVVPGAHDVLPDPDRRCGRLRVLHATGSTLLIPEFA